MEHHGIWKVRWTIAESARRLAEALAITPRAQAELGLAGLKDVSPTEAFARALEQGTLSVHHLERLSAGDRMALEVDPSDQRLRVVERGRGDLTVGARDSGLQTWASRELGRKIHATNQADAAMTESARNSRSESKVTT